MTNFNIVFPPSSRQLLDGGKNNKYERSIIGDNESPDCANVKFSNGAVETRGGSQKLNTTSVGSFACDGIYTRRDNSGAETMCAFFGGRMFTWAASTFTTVPSATSVFTAGVRIGAAQYENHLFMGNGNVDPYKYNGTNFTRHGVPAPSSISTATSQATGVLTGDFVYKVSFVNSQAVEGDVGSASVTFTAASATNRVTIPTAPVSYGVNARRLYRATSPSGTFLRVTEIADNTTTTYDDNVSIASLTVTAPTDNGVPPKYNVCVYHQNRLICNDTDNPNLVWYSELAEPYTFPSTNFIAIGDASGDLVKGLEVYENSVLVTCENSPHLIRMPDTDPDNWTTIRISSPYGTKSPYGAARYNNKVMVPAVQNTKFVGFAATVDGTIDPEATSLESTRVGADLKSDRIEPDMFDVQETLLGRISAIVFKNKMYISVPYGSTATGNNRIYVYDFSISNLNKKQEGSWVPYTGLSAEQFTIYDGKLYFGVSTETGYVYQMETDTYNDDGSAINSYVWTKEFSGNKGDENAEKDFRFVWMLLEKAGAYYMNLAYRLDSDKGSGQSLQVDLNPGGSLWGSMIFGVDLWGGGSDQEDKKVSVGQVRGKRIQFKFSNQNIVDQRFKVHGLNFTYNIRGIR